MVSLICCYNNITLYENMKKSLEKQTIEYELIGIDNREGQYKSAAVALNVGGASANGDIFIFLHQDIVFENENSLENYIRVIPKDRAAIVGLFGASHKKRRTIAYNLYEAETLDECCVAMSRKVYEQLRFNEVVCNSWHLYVVEMCLRASEQNILVASGKFEIKHLSSGMVDESYMKTFKELISIYKKKRWIATTCKVLPTNLFVFYLYFICWKVKKHLFGNLPLLHSIKKVFQLMFGD